MQADPLHGKKKYMVLLQRLANKEDNVINVEIDDLQEFFK